MRAAIPRNKKSHQFRANNCASEMTLVEWNVWLVMAHTPIGMDNKNKPAIRHSR